MTSLRSASAASLLALLAACGAPEEDDIGVTEEVPVRTEGDLAAGPANGSTMDLDGDAMDRPGGALTEALDSDASGDFLTVARQDGRFATLLGVVEAAGLSDTLRSGRYTLLAPTDEAFAALPDGTVEQLLRPENREQLVTVLQYHVLEEPIRSGEIDGTVEATTLAGDTLVLETVGERVLVGGEGGAVVTTADIAATNGVLHVIDQVLIPPSG